MEKHEYEVILASPAPLPVLPLIDDDDPNLANLLVEFKLEAVFDYLKAAHVTFRSLEYMNKEDLKEAIPPLGLRMEFREKLFSWKKEKFGIEEDSLKTPVAIQKASLHSASATKLFDKDLASLLAETFNGKDILQFYDVHKILSKEKRDVLIRIVIESIVNKNVRLGASDFMNVVSEICDVFPSEKQVKVYYYIPRNGKNNPSGKLYGKYRNLKSKKAKLAAEFSYQNHKDADLDSLEEESDETPLGNIIKTPEVDTSVAAAYKLSLNRDSADWEDVLRKWTVTFNARQEDLEKMGSIEFLKNWPKLGHSRASDLINIDFKTKIAQFYERNLNNDFSKQLFSYSKSTINKDAQDYILLILLNAVLPSAARFKDKVGKRNKKPTIIDVQESFILRVTTINDYRETGIKEACIFQNLRYFHVTENFVFDLMHDIYEGVCVYDICNAD